MKYTPLLLTLLLPVALVCMEPVEVRIDLTPAKPTLSAQLISSIKSGNITDIHQKLVKPQTRAAQTNAPSQSLDELIQALGYTKGELALQESQMAKKVLDTFTTRYRQTLIPLFLCALAVANIAVSSNNFVTSTAADKSLISFSVNMAASGLAALGFGYETWLQIRKGWTDHRQKKLVQQLQNSELLIQLLQASAMKDGVISPFEQQAIEKAQMQNVQLQVQLAQATIDAQNASAAADSNLALQVSTATQSTTQTQTRSLKTAQHGAQSQTKTPNKKKKKKVRRAKSTGQIEQKKLE